MRNYHRGVGLARLSIVNNFLGDEMNNLKWIMVLIFTISLFSGCGGVKIYQEDETRHVYLDCMEIHEINTAIHIKNWWGRVEECIYANEVYIRSMDRDYVDSIKNVEYRKAEIIAKEVEACFDL